jgi:hypothetical protein
VVEGRLEFGTEATRPTGCNSYSSVHSNRLTIVRDGRNIRGSFEGGVYLMAGDTAREEKTTGTLVGTPDLEPPIATLLGPPRAADALSVTISEPLAADTKVVLVSPDGTRRPLERQDVSGRLLAFSLPEPLGLAPARLVFEPPLVDLTGNLGPAELSIEPVPLPLLPEDGFEGPTAPLLSGEARFADKEYLPISGARSLLVPSHGHDGWISFRLAVAPGDQVIRAKVRAIRPQPGTTSIYSPVTLAGAHGGSRLYLLMMIDQPIQRVGSHWEGPVQEIELPLPPGTEGEVVVDIQRAVDCSQQGGLSGPSNDLLLLDDVRVE